jgi:hypothetical protein
MNQLFLAATAVSAALFSLAVVIAVGAAVLSRSPARRHQGLKVLRILVGRQRR